MARRAILAAIIGLALAPAVHGAVDSASSLAEMPQCSDGIDNDGDGIVDWINESGCLDSSDNSENSALECDLVRRELAAQTEVKGFCTGSFSQIAFAPDAASDFDGFTDIFHVTSCTFEPDYSECAAKRADQNDLHEVEARLPLDPASGGLTVTLWDNPCETCAPSGTAVPTVAATSDLSVEISGPARIHLGIDSFSYEITVTNNHPTRTSPGGLLSVDLSQDLPGIRALRASLHLGACRVTSRRVLCAVQSLEPGQQAVIVLESATPPVGVMTARAEITNLEADDVPLNNVDEAPIEVVDLNAAPPTGGCRADLAITSFEIVDLTGTAQPLVIAVHKHYFARITVTNKGPDTVDATALLTRGWEGTPETNNTDALPVGLLAPGESRSVEFPFSPVNYGTIRWTANVVGLECADLVAHNNSATFTLAQAWTAESALAPPDHILRPVSWIFPARARAGTNRPYLGRSTTPNDVAKVQLAVLRLQGRVRALRVAPACFWLTTARGGFVKRKPVNGVCAKPVWLPMKKVAGNKWLFRVLGNLPPGKYIAYSRAINRAGLAEETFVAGKNRRAFTVRRR